jgi:hypothetical protein
MNTNSTPPDLSPAPKAWYTSRTLWVAAVALLGRFTPGPIGELLRAHQTEVVEVALGLVAALRLDTDRSVTFGFTRKF